MKTVGSILKEARIAKNLTLTDGKNIEIRAKFLDAIEQDAYQLLPSPFMQRVCQKLWRVLRPRQQSCDGVFSKTDH